MSIIEYMAAVLAIVVIVKLLVILIKPSAWMNLVVKPVYSNSAFLMIVGLVLAAGSLYYLLQELTIVQIFATMFFFAMIAMVTAATYNKEIVSLGSKMLRNKHFMRKAWLSIIIWFVLAIWALKELFF